MSAFERVMTALSHAGEHVVVRYGEARTRGICHDGDAADTVSIKIGKDKNVVVWCHKCQDNTDFLDALKLTKADLFDEPKAKGTAEHRISTWTYRDENGQVVQYVDRYEPKAFRPRLPDGSHKHPPRDQRVIYNLPKVRAAADAGEIVVICEGERDADNVIAAGYVATTPPGGSGMGWQDRYTQMLTGVSRVHIVADNDPDDTGLKHARKVAASLSRAGIEWRIYLPAVGKDVSDHLAARLEVKDLVRVTDDSAPAAPAQTDGALAVLTLAPPVEDEEQAPWPEEVPNDFGDRFPRIDWKEAFATDFSQIDWLPGRFMERGQQVTLVGDGKVGKSLFALYWIWCAISGRSVLGDIPREPINVVYFDRENSLRDIVSRLSAFGATEADLDRLEQHFDYRLFPRFSGALNASAVAAAELLTIVDEQPRDVVIFDTVSRYIAGKENDSDTWLSLYDRIHAPLKGQGVASLRLDHFGKDAEKGVRGSSAKTQDVDHVWELTQYDGNTVPGEIETIVSRLKMRRTHTRTGLGEDLIHITRRGEKERNGGWLPGRTRHELTDPKHAEQHNQEIQSYVDQMVMRGVPAGLGRDALKAWAKRNGVSLPGNTEKLAEVVKALKTALKETA